MANYMDNNNATEVFGAYASKINKINPISITWANYQLLSETDKNSHRYIITDYPAQGAGQQLGTAAFKNTGVANGVADLDANGKVPASELPSYVDDIIEGYLYNGVFYTDSEHEHAITGETGKIYVDLVSDKTYRWSGSGYVEISESLALGETSSTAYAGNKGKANADAIAALQSGKIDKESGKGLSTNDYTDEDKAKLDIDTHTLEGNPLSFTTDSTQVAKDAVITIEPIQAGSGDPSPSNVRAISGLSEIGILSCGKNLCDNNKVVKGYYGDNGIWIQDNDFASSDFIVVKPNTSYSTILFDNNGNSIDTLAVTFWSASKGFQRQVITSPFQTDSDTKYVVVRTYQSDSGYVTTNNFKFQLEEGSTATTYEPYKSSTDLTIQLGQTVYGGTLDLKNGVLTVKYGIVDLGTLSWHNDTTIRPADGATIHAHYASLTDCKIVDYAADIGNMYCAIYKATTISEVDRGGSTTVKDAIMGGADGNNRIWVYDSRYNDTSEADFKTAMSGIMVIYELATPYTIQLTPHEISLLQGINNVSTTADSIKLTYSDGVLATLEDVKQVGESVNALSDRTPMIINRKEYFTSASEISYTGVSIPVEFGKIYVLSVRLIYQNSQPYHVSVSEVNNAVESWRIIADADGCYVSFIYSPAANNVDNLYIWATYSSATENYILIKGFVYQ